MLNITLSELSQKIKNQESFKFKPKNNYVFKLIMALCNYHGVFFPGGKHANHSYKYHKAEPIISVNTWLDGQYFIAIPVKVEDQNQPEIKLIF